MEVTRYVLIGNGTVVNATIFEGQMPEGWAGADVWLESPDAQIGWVFDGETFIPTAEPEPTPPPPLTKLYKSTFIRRMSPSEAAVMEQVLQDEDAWLRMLYHSIEYFMMDDALIMYLHMTLEGAFGETRANELLEPEL